MKKGLLGRGSCPTEWICKKP